MGDSRNRLRNGGNKRKGGMEVRGRRAFSLFLSSSGLSPLLGEVIGTVGELWDAGTSGSRGREYCCVGTGVGVGVLDLLLVLYSLPSLPPALCLQSLLFVETGSAQYIRILLESLYTLEELVLFA